MIFLQVAQIVPEYSDNSELMTFLYRENTEQMTFLLKNNVEQMAYL